MLLFPWAHLGIRRYDIGTSKPYYLVNQTPIIDTTIIFWFQRNEFYLLLLVKEWEQKSKPNNSMVLILTI